MGSSEYSNSSPRPQAQAWNKIKFNTFKKKMCVWKIGYLIQYAKEKKTINWDIIESLTLEASGRLYNYKILGFFFVCKVHMQLWHIQLLTFMTALFDFWQEFFS